MSIYICINILDTFNNLLVCKMKHLTLLCVGMIVGVNMFPKNMFNLKLPDYLSNTYTQPIPIKYSANFDLATPGVDGLVDGMAFQG